MDEDVELAPILDDLATRPPLDLSYSQDTEARLPAVLGGRTVALARSFKVLDPVEESATSPWERAFRTSTPGLRTELSTG